MIPCAKSERYSLLREGELRRAFDRVLESGRYILGAEVESFEEEFAAYVGVAHSVGVNSGTDALALALKACEIGPGDEVITVSHSAVATAAAVVLAGAVPVFVDIEPEHLTISADEIEGAITPRTKGIIPVHLHGQPANMESIVRVARTHGLRVIEDCAQAHGALYRERHVGTIGDLGCFSFYPTKNLGALGDGGAVVTDSAALAERVRLLRQYGWKNTPESTIPGANSRLDELQAAFLRVQLRYLDDDNRRRQLIARRYDQAFCGTAIQVPPVRAECVHAYHHYVIRPPLRDQVRQYLEMCQIQSLVHYPHPIHRQPAYNSCTCSGRLPETERAASEVLSLPMFPELSEEEVAVVVEAVLAGYHAFVNSYCCR